MKKVILALIRAFARLLPFSQRSTLAIEFLHPFNYQTDKNREELIKLLEYDNTINVCLSRAACESNGGEHPKHRLMRYADFFSERIVDGESVIDIGCGNGYVALNVASGHPQSKILGIDHNPVNIEAARKKNTLSNLSFILGDFYRDLPREKFDKIILSNVLEHIDKRPEFLKEVIGSTGAREILIRVPLFDRDWKVPLKKELGIESRLDNTHFIEYTQEVFLDEMREAGLKIKHMEIRWSEIWAHLEVA